MTAVARLESVSKSFGSVCALDDVSYEIPTGEIVALLGPNGAGKTTSLSLLLGLRRPDRGTAQLFGRDPTSPGDAPSPRNDPSGDGVSRDAPG